MGVYLTIDGVTTPLTYGPASNAIQLQSMQLATDTDATKQVISVSKRVTAATPQIYSLAMSRTQKPMALYTFDDDTQEGLVMQLGNATLSGWMLSYEAPASPREFFTIEAPHVSVKT